jgi:bifunctional non-homologous end joining protein LigD
VKAAGRPSFNALQNYGSTETPIFYYVFDVMTIAGADITREPLAHRLELLEEKILPKLGEPIRYASELDVDLPDLIETIRTHGLEGLIAKRRDSC